MMAGVVRSVVSDVDGDRGVWRDVRGRADDGRAAAAARSPQVADQQGPQTPGAQGQRGRGRGPAGPVGPPRQTAPVDLTGNWVSVVTEDWQWRMTTPKKGDYASVPLSVAGRAEADKWTEAMDGRCEAYGVGGIMRMPGRLRISWQDDTTLKIETDAGEQTRLLRFAPAGPAGAAPVSAAGAADAAGYVGGRVAAARWRLRRLPRARRRPGRPGTSLGIAESGHHQPHRRVAAAQRRALQPERRHHRVPTRASAIPRAATGSW